MQKNGLLHGGDYNPEQWLDSPEVLEEDIIFMKEAGVNCVTLGVFSWTMLEPEEGIYNFEWLEHIIDKLYQNDIKVILATPSGAMPHWMTQKYPEVMQTSETGKRNLPGRRHNFCYTSPIMRKKIREMDLKLSEHFGHHEAVILWHISNELGGNFGDGACHCELCQEAFRGWLKQKYGTLENLNRAWWNRFWSHEYTEWDQIHSPASHGECLVHGLKLDWRRFVSEQMTDFCKQEILALREYSNLSVTTNFMEFFKNLDYHVMQKCLDIISWDNYPDWHSHKDDVPTAVLAAANHSVMRSLKKQPFLMMESSPSRVNWRPSSAVKRPGMHMLSSMQAIAHGSDSVQYFQWRKSRGAYEKFHGAVVGHTGGNNTRVFREVSEVGKRLARISASVKGTKNHPKAAFIFDWENWWALEDCAGPRQNFDYISELVKHYQAFWEHGIEADFIGMEDNLSGYEMVCAPLNYLYKPGYVQKVQEYVEQGGCYVTTYFSGIVDDTDLCFIKEHPLKDVLGLTQEEIDSPSEEVENYFYYKGQKYPTGHLCEVCHPEKHTKVLAAYEKDYYQGFPVVTEHSYGKGICYYLAAETDLSFLRRFYGDVFESLHIQNPLGVKLPYGVTVTEREGKESVVFVMNFSDAPVLVEGISEWKDLETGEAYSGKMEMEGFTCKILIK